MFSVILLYHHATDIKDNNSRRTHYLLCNDAAGNFVQVESHDPKITAKFANYQLSMTDSVSILAFCTITFIVFTGPNFHDQKCQSIEDFLQIVSWCTYFVFGPVTGYYFSTRHSGSVFDQSSRLSDDSLAASQFG